MTVIRQLHATRYNHPKSSSDLLATKRKLENIAVGVDISCLHTEKEEKFNFQQAFFIQL